MTFEELLLKHRGVDYTPPETLLCLDPGFTTGVAVFTNGKLTHWEQVTTITDYKTTPHLQWDNLLDLFARIKPTKIVCEDYRIYTHKLDQHNFSGVDTLRLIGGIDMLAQVGYPIAVDARVLEMNLPVSITYQMASMAKGFCTDDKLKHWNYWQPGMKHSRDAIRHGCYYMLFNKEGQNEHH